MKLKKADIFWLLLFLFAFSAYALSELSKHKLQYTMSQGLGEEDQIRWDSTKNLMRSAIIYRELSSGYIQNQIKTHPENINLTLDSLQSYVIPDAILSLQQIRSLTINGKTTDKTILKYKLVSISKNISNLENLTHLDVSNNSLTKLPISISDLKKLKFINVSNNLLREEELKKLKKMVPVDCKIQQ